VDGWAALNDVEAKNFFAVSQLLSMTTMSWSQQFPEQEAKISWKKNVIILEGNNS